MDSKDVGKYIKAIREEKKISQRKLAEMIGRGESTIGNYETGATDIPCSALSGHSTGDGDWTGRTVWSKAG